MKEFIVIILGVIDVQNAVFPKNCGCTFKISIPNVHIYYLLV